MMKMVIPISEKMFVLKNLLKMLLYIFMKHMDVASLTFQRAMQAAYIMVDAN